MKFLFLFISVVLLGVAYLCHPSTYPWLLYNSEILIFLSILIISFLISTKTIKTPKFLLPMVLIVFIPLIQFVLGKVYYFTTAFFSSVYLLLFLISILITYNASNFLSKNQIGLIIVVFFALISTIISIFGVIQWLGLGSGLDFIFPLRGNRIYSNIGQPNKMATVILLGLLSLIYLFDNYKIKTYYIFPLFFLNIWVLVLSQSRTAFISILIFLIFNFIKKNKFKYSKTNYMICFFALSYFLLYYSNHYISSYFGIITPQTLQERLTTGYLRLEMWQHMIYAIIQEPWFGYGWYQTNFAQLEGVTLYNNEGYLISAHNIVIDLILWVGAPFAIIILTYGLFIIKRVYLNINSSNDFLIFCMILSILIHANLEFPLFSALFIMPCGIFLGFLLKKSNNNEFLLNTNFVKVFLLLLLAFISYIYKEYDVWQSRLGYASGLQGSGELPLDDKDSLIFSHFRAREMFLLAEVQERRGILEIKNFQRYVNSQPSYFNLFKMAQILYFNKYFDEVNEIIKIINSLYNKNILIVDISDKERLNSKKISF